MSARVTALTIGVALAACAPSSDRPAGGAPPGAPAAAAGLAGVKDDASAKDVVKVAAGSPDHTTLVAAVGAAGLTDVLASSGPYTVFAPTNAAFDKLPKGTVEDLLKPANRSALQGILRHHVTTSAYQPSELKDGMVLSMADGSSATITKKGDDIYLGEAKVLGSVRASNGMVYIVDAVIVPPKT